MAQMNHKVRGRVTGSVATTTQMRQIKAMRKNDQGYNACPEWNAECCGHLSVIIYHI